jgi:hypothetical protein
VTWTRFDPDEICRRLHASREGSNAGANDADAARFCPYFVPLAGELGGEWGVIVNPASARFATVTAEGDRCGCPDDTHLGAPWRDGDTWSTRWVHDCGPFCDRSCPWS